MKVVNDLRDLHEVVKKGEPEIRINDPAKTEISILTAENPNDAGKSVLTGLACGVGGVAAAVLTGGILIPFALWGIGLFKFGKGWTYDNIKYIKTSKDLKNAQNQIANKYNGLDFGDLVETIRNHYTVTKEDNAYAVIRYK